MQEIENLQAKYNKLVTQYNKLYCNYLDLEKCNNDLLAENKKLPTKYKLSDIQLANKGANDCGYYEVEKEKLNYKKHIEKTKLKLILLIYLIFIALILIIELAYLKCF